MDRPLLPLNALRAFEASARHLSFTKAAIELCVTQAAVSQQVRSLEVRLAVELFRRLPRGLALSDEGRSLLPTLRESFDLIAQTLDRFAPGAKREVLVVGSVSTFALGWLLPRLKAFHELHPSVELRLSTNNNRVDIAAEGLDYAIRFGSGAWHATVAEKVFDAPMAPVCVPAIAARLKHPNDLKDEVLLRSYRSDEWSGWASAAGTGPLHSRGPMFDSSLALAEVAASGAGVALVPTAMFQNHIAAGRLVCPFSTSVSLGSYWLTWLQSRSMSSAMLAFRNWLKLETAISNA
ncbi:LysR family transcriptional regulator, regulator of gene expression of beta-lactamase [Bosea sp. OK403]|uniref:LysR family transcriptional regulator n=1 Tax=Bosea sp. OK403 TaxID=1855286 RepID=UPI0008E52025|nr:LysR family transcriptional regulator [Bosea sp. OK403]SFJ30589.1 LysR family transcriptional regulator, regulator of gene expression of beta-lactamase [Bosea sp. OK403]